MDQKIVKSTVHSQIILFQSLQMGELLGHGGYGDVYKAVWCGTTVAVKQLHLKTLAAHLQTEFMQEANMMAHCQFPNIVSFYGICTEEGHAALIMEYMPKGSLYGILQNKQEELLWHVRWSIAIDIGKGIQYLHSRNILHRDLKSLNVLLGDNYQAKLCDFGLAKVKLESSSISTKSNKVVGTTRWMAPELLSMDDDAPSATKASDIYSYGMILWEISAREIPFKSAKNETVAGMWIMGGKKEKVPNDCPAEYSVVLQTCWLDPQARPSAKKVVTCLTKAKSIQTIHPVSNLQKTLKDKSWHFDPQTMPTEREVALSEGKIFQLLDATPKDKRTVVELYQRNSVSGLEVGDVRVIYNKTFNIKFHEHLKTLQQRAGNPVFLPKWPLMSNPVLRQEVYTLFEETCKPFADPDFPDVKIMPGWHGTKQAAIDSIFKTGFSNLATTDSGFFGKGLYSACEANYAYEVYTKNQGPNGALILNWVAIFSAFPVINNGEFKPRKPGKQPERHGDMCFLTGKGNFGNHDAHFVPVMPKSTNGFDYIPCGINQKYVAREIVTFESAACLPRYLVKLRPYILEFPLTTSGEDVYQEGRILYDRCKYSEASSYFQKAAKQGYPPAYLFLGVLCQFGYCSEKNKAYWHSKAASHINWFKERTVFGKPDSEINLGFCYANGIGIKQDLNVAFKHYYRAANLGYSDGKFCVGFLYESGNGTVQNLKRALCYYESAAQQGHVEAQFQAGKLYYYGGSDVEINFELAKNYCQMAASAGHRDAKILLSKLIVSNAGKTVLAWFLPSSEQEIVTKIADDTQKNLSADSNQQKLAFKRLFFALPKSNPIDEARYHLFGFFTTRDKQSFGCTSKDCYAFQKEMDAVYEKSFHK